MYFKGKRQCTLAEQANDVSYNYYTSAGKIMVLYTCRWVIDRRSDIPKVRRPKPNLMKVL